MGQPHDVPGCTSLVVYNITMGPNCGHSLH